jgi:hypothetical protein
MKKVVLALALALTSFVGTSASADTEIAFWNMYSKRGSAPIMRARNLRSDVLSQITFNSQDPYFEAYNDVNGSGDISGSGAK